MLGRLFILVTSDDHDFIFANVSSILPYFFSKAIDDWDARRAFVWSDQGRLHGLGKTHQTTQDRRSAAGDRGSSGRR
jgi:hypothetical protein